MKLWVFVGLAVGVAAAAQSPNNGATCDSGTPIPFESAGMWGYLTTSGVKITSVRDSPAS
jgi:hypothetical protein